MSCGTPKCGGAKKQDAPKKEEVKLILKNISPNSKKIYDSQGKSYTKIN